MYRNETLRSSSTPQGDPPSHFNLIPAQMASGSGTHREVIELTQETDLSHEVIITSHFLFPLRNVCGEGEWILFLIT